MSHQEIQPVSAADCSGVIQRVLCTPIAYDLSWYPPEDLDEESEFGDEYSVHVVGGQPPSNDPPLGQPHGHRDNPPVNDPPAGVPPVARPNPPPSNPPIDDPPGGGRPPPIHVDIPADPPIGQDPGPTPPVPPIGQPNNVPTVPW